jgi:hypothetical protein
LRTQLPYPLCVCNVAGRSEVKTKLKDRRGELNPTLFLESREPGLCEQEIAYGGTATSTLARERFATCSSHHSKLQSTERAHVSMFEFASPARRLARRSHRAWTSFRGTDFANLLVRPRATSEKEYSSRPEQRRQEKKENQKEELGYRFCRLISTRLHNLRQRGRSTRQSLSLSFPPLKANRTEERFPFCRAAKLKHEWDT